MSMFGLLLNNKQPSMKDIEKAMLGNLSRCNGYRAVYQAFKYVGRERERHKKHRRTDRETDR